MLLTRAFVPLDIKTIIKGADFASNIYEYIPLRSKSIYPSFISIFEYKLTNSVLGDVEINYDSTIANSYTFFASFVLVIIIHVGICFLKLCLSKWKKSENWWMKRLIRWIDKIFNLLTFDYYIRNSLEISQFLLISSVNEINQHSTGEFLRLASFVFAILMVFFYVSVLLVVNYLIFSLYEMDESKHNKIGEFFWDIKDNKKSRFYVTMLLLRRLVFVTLLVTITSVSSRSLIGTLIFLQFLYGGYIAFSRPYREAKGNFIEIMNEVYFTLFLSTFMAFNYEDDWTSFKTSVYIWVHVSNFVMVFLIVLSKFSKCNL